MNKVVAQTLSLSLYELSFQVWLNSVEFDQSYWFDIAGSQSKGGWLGGLLSTNLNIVMALASLELIYQ